MMRQTVFTIEACPKAYIGYTTSRLWNGWATPYFEKAEAIRVMEDYNRQNESPIFYNEEFDTFYHFGTDSFGGEMWRGEEYATKDGIKHLYGIGAFAWIWDAVTEEDCIYLAEAIDEFIYDYDTYGYRDVGIDREEMVEAIENQLKELTVLQQVYEVWHSEDLNIDERFEKLGGILKL